MERLTVEEIIERYKRKANGIASYRKGKEYWEYKQIKEYLEELKRYKELEEQGKLIITPCRQGDTVYIVKKVYRSKESGGNEVAMARVTGICSVRNLEGEIIWCIRVFDKYGEYLLPFRTVGKSVFLTEQKANEALEKMKEDNE